MRNTVEIQVWMKRQKPPLLVKDIQAALGYQTYTGISNTIAGRDHLRKVLRYLLKAGCPERFLDLPKGMRKAAKVEETIHRGVTR